MRKRTVQELKRPSATEYARQPKRPVCVVLDQVRSAQNVGSVFRTSDAFMVEKVVLAGITPRPPHKDILKTALGASETVEWKYEPDVVTALKLLREEGYTLIAVEQAEGAVSLDKMIWHPECSYAVIFGNEVNGVSDAAMELVDAAVEVPQWGTKHSLNISVCAGLVLWDYVRSQRISR